MNNITKYSNGFCDELAKKRKQKLLAIYDSTDLMVYTQEDLEQARQELLSYKSEGMRRYDAFYKRGVSYCLDVYISEDDEYIKGEMLALFDILQESFARILHNDHTEDWENLHLALVKALEEWAYQYHSDLQYIKEDHKNEWWAIIEDIANKLANRIDEADSKNASSENIFSLTGK